MQPVNCFDPHSLAMAFLMVAGVSLVLGGWLGARIERSRKPQRCDDHMHSRAVDVATTHLQLPPRPPPGTRRAA